MDYGMVDLNILQEINKSPHQSGVFFVFDIWHRSTLPTTCPLKKSSMISLMVGGYNFYMANVCVCPWCNVASKLIHPDGSMAIESVVVNVVADQYCRTKPFSLEWFEVHHHIGYWRFFKNGWVRISLVYWMTVMTTSHLP